MNKNRILAYGIGAILLGILVYIQFRGWSHFDWPTFWRENRRLGRFPGLYHILHAIGLIYLGYVIRAIRWKIFLKPVRPDTSSIRLVAPTMIGFTGLALLGRPGELIRPYLIARRVNLPVSSQVAVWAVERIFDVGAFTFLLILATFFATAPKRLSHYGSFRDAGLLFSGLVVAMIVGAWTISRKGDALANWIERKLAHLRGNLGHKIALRIREFGQGLHTIHGPLALFESILLSIMMWCLIALAYKEVAHAYGREALEIPQTQVLLLMGSSMLGSLIQLPGVGGGSQMATIAMLRHVFDVPQELALGCGLMLWLVTFMSVAPIGLILAHRERLSLRKLSEESHQQEENSQTPPG